MKERLVGKNDNFGKLVKNRYLGIIWNVEDDLQGVLRQLYLKNSKAFRTRYRCHIIMRNPE